jgi:hypothetical protein
VAERATGRRWRAVWLLGSLAVHAGLLGVGAWRHHHAAEPWPAKVSLAQELDIELLAELAQPVPPADAAPERDGARAAAVAARRVDAALRGAPSPELASNEVAPDADADAGDEVEGPAGDEAPSAAPSAAGPRLSLAQLGVGNENPFFDRGDPAVARAEKAARVKRRLDRALAQGLVDQDTARGRGAGSPVLRSLQAAVYASTAPLNGQASFIFVIDSEGKLLSTSLGEASGDREAWSRVARQTALALAQRKLTVPKGKSVRLTVAVSSHLELPSGADPGVEVDVLGLPVKKGGGPRAAKVDLLNPRSPLAPLSLLGDPADIGQNARRMVHAHVVSEELL